MTRRAGRPRPGRSPRRGSASRLAQAALLTAASALIASCTAGPSAQSVVPHDRAEAALARLQRQAESASDARDPVTFAPPFASMEPIARDDAGRGNADASLEDALRDLLNAGPGDGVPSEGEPGEGTATADPEHAGEDHARALALYAEARQRAADDGHARAIRLLEEAAQLDPSSPEVWRALADARRGAGFASSSGIAYTRAAELGITEPEALTLAGLHQIDQGNTREGAAYLARAVTSPTPHADPLVAEIAAAALGEALLDTGWTRAGCEALDVGLRTGPAAVVRTNLGIEAVTLHRGLSDLLVRLGDARFSLAEPGLAADAYRLAAEQPGGDRPEISSRLIAALRSVGRDEAAALVLIEELREGSPVTPTTLDAFSSLSRAIRPRSLVADTIAGIAADGSPARAADLLLARAAALPDGDARRLLSSALLASPSTATGEHDRSPTAIAAHTELGRTRLVTALLKRTPDARRVREISRLVAARPVLAPAASSALLLHTAEPQDLLNRLGEESAPGAGLTMLAEHALATQNRELLESALRDANRLPATPTPDAEFVSRRARLAAALGRWDSYERDLETLRTMPAAERPLLDALGAGQRFTEAFVLARRIADATDANVDDLLTLAAIAGQLGETEAGRGALLRAVELDRFDDRVYNALLAFHGPGGPMPDNDLRNEAARLLRQNAPGGTLLRQMIAAELIRRGLLDEAAPRLASLFAEDQTQPQTLEAMLAFWTSLAAADRADEIDLSHARAAGIAHPGSIGLARLLAGGELLLERPADALGVIDAFQEQSGSPLLARMREQIFSEQLGDTARAEELTAERLAPSPRSIEQCIELAAHHAGRLERGTDGSEQVSRVLAALGEIPERADLTRRQLGPLDSVLSAVAQHLQARREQTPDPDATSALAADGLAIIDWAADRSVPLGPAMHELRLTLQAEADAPFDRLAEAAEAAIAAYPGSERAFVRRLADLLLARSRGADADRWVSGRVFNDDGTVIAPMLTEWIRLPLITADTDSARELIRRLESRGALLDAWRSLRNGQDDPPGRDGGSPAEFAYLLAQYAAGTADPEAVPAFLRLALEYDPRHPWVANDLGYRLLEGEGSVTEAERLIAIAYEQLSDEAAIVDSLGWARYHLGHLEDTTDPETGEVIPGAVTLLRKAAELAGDDDDGVVSDHLGDALFRSGRTDEAMEAWADAAKQASRLQNRLRASGTASGLRLREIQSLASAAAMKRNAVQLDQPPGVAPQRGIPADPEPPESSPGSPAGTSP